MANNNPTAAIIVIGNEILSGRTQDKNVNYIAKGLAEIGVKLMEVRVIPDIHETIINTLNEMRAKFSYVFTTGGIGPTHDDITTEAVAAAFGVKITEHEESLKRITEYYKGELNDGRRKMIMLPEGSGAISNPISVAPGFYIENVYVMAGIPNVMQAMFDSIKASLKGGKPIIAKELKIFGSESRIAVPLEQLQERNKDVDIGSYPFVENTQIGTSLVIRGTDASRIDAVYSEMLSIMKEIATLA